MYREITPNKIYTPNSEDVTQYLQTEMYHHTLFHMQERHYIPTSIQFSYEYLF